MVKNGILLIHGLADSPYLMRDIGPYFLANCFLVRSILLPGHGTTPGDLLEVEYQDWIKATRYGIDSFSGQVDNFYMAGFSTGGTLSVYMGLIKEQIKALLLFSPAIRIKSNLGFMANWHKTISWADSDKKWIDVAPDEDFAKYESFPFNAADQIYLLTKITGIKEDGSTLSMPVFMAMSESDATIDAKEAIDFFTRQSNPENRMILHSNRTKESKDQRIERRKSAYPERRILDFSH